MTEHKLRAGDRVIVPLKQGQCIEADVVFADHASGWFAPSVAGDSWESPISPAQLIRRATDEEHEAFLDRLQAAQDGGIDYKAGASALQMYRPKASPPSPLAFPRELTPVLREVLGLPNFMFIHEAELWRKTGTVIARRSEDEQSFFLHTLVCLALEHGEGWRPKFMEMVAERVAKVREAAKA